MIAVRIESVFKSDPDPDRIGSCKFWFVDPDSEIIISFLDQELYGSRAQIRHLINHSKMYIILLVKIVKFAQYFIGLNTLPTL